MTALWHIIHLLEERVEVLENTLEVSREHISKNEEKCDNLQKQGKRSVYFYFLNNCSHVCVREPMTSVPGNLVRLFLFFVFFIFIVEKILEKKLVKLPLDADTLPGIYERFPRKFTHQKKRNNNKTLIF